MDKDKIAILGLGYVGLPLAVTFASGPYSVIGIDVDGAKVDLVNRGENFILDVDDEALASLVAGGKIEASTDFSRIREAAAVIICVPTPLDKMRSPDLSLVESATLEISKHLKKGHLVVLESTTYPGTTREILAPILAGGGLEPGVDFNLAFSPERVDPGNETWKTENTPKIIGGLTEACTTRACDLYGKVLGSLCPVTTPEAAEMAKLLENIFRSVNIALVNELATLCERMGVDVWEVIDAAATKPFGFMGFYPGPGLGGHCIPIDPFYLSWKAKEYDFFTEFIELAGKINENMPYYVVERVGSALNSQEKSLKGAKILVLGITYKKDVPDMRESPATKIIGLLKREGADVTYHDPFVPESAGMSSVPLSRKNLSASDCVLLAADHSELDYGLILEAAPLIFDTRNAFRGKKRDGLFKL